MTMNPISASDQATISGRPLDDDPLRSSDEFARQARLSPRTVNAWRSRGRGPDFVKVGGKVYYRQSAIDRWLKGQERSPVVRS